MNILIRIFILVTLPFVQSLSLAMTSGFLAFKQESPVTGAVYRSESDSQSISFGRRFFDGVQRPVLLQINNEPSFDNQPTFERLVEKSTFVRETSHKGRLHWRLPLLDQKVCAIALSVASEFTLLPSQVSKAAEPATSREQQESLSVAAMPIAEQRHPIVGGLHWQKNGVSAVRFYWRCPEEKECKVQLEISSSRKFNTIIKTELVGKPPYVWQNNLLGRFYWRLATIDASNKPIAYTPVWEYLVVPQLPETRGPDGDTIAFGTRKPTIDFAWESDVDPLFFRFKIAKTPDFNEPEVNIDTELRSMSINDLGEGTYYWKTGVKASRYLPIQYSKTRSFVITKRDPKLYTPPVLISPVDALEMPAYSDTRLVLFKWQKTENTTNYQMQVATSPSFEEAVSFVSNQTEIKQNLPVGSYYWRVKALDHSGDESNWSSTRSFNMKPIALSIKQEMPVKGGTVGSFVVDFRWQELKGCNIYEISVATSDKLDPIIMRKETSAVGLEYEFDDEGFYHWAVQCIAGEQKEVMSQINPFRVFVAH